MRSMLLIIALLIPAVSALALDYDQNVTPDVIFGAGNANGAFTVFNTTTPSGDAMEIGLRAKVRFNEIGQPENTFNSDGNGGYYFLTGGPGGITPAWCFEWHVNCDATGTGVSNLDDYYYELGLDYDSSPTGTNYVAFDPITPTVEVPVWDHVMGDNSTPNGGGVVAGSAGEYLANLGQYNVIQQSWRYDWFDTYGTFNPNDIGVYEIYLKVFNAADDALVGESNISVSVGGAVADEDASWSEIKTLYR